MTHTFVALVEDGPGVLNRVASLFRRRGFNIESLTVGRTAKSGVSRMTIVIERDQASADRLLAYLCRLINVLHVEQLHGDIALTRDLALVKVSADTIDRVVLHRLVDQMGAHIVDSGDRTITVEIAGEPPHVDTAVHRLASLGIVEMVRTGQVAMRRGDTAISCS